MTFYFDDNSSSPPLIECQQMLVNMKDLYGNASSSHFYGKQVLSVLDRARENLAKSLNTNEKSITFTSGASESNRLFVDMLSFYSQSIGRPLKILCSPFEHQSLLKPLLNLIENKKAKTDFLTVDNEGYWGDLSHLHDQQYDFFICTKAHNETGILPNIKKVLSYLNHKPLVMSDIAQSFARTFDLYEEVDILTLSGQKIGAYAGSGALVIKNGAEKLKSPWQGGAQERGLRPGTENAIFIATLGEAARLIENTRASYKYILHHRKQFDDFIMKNFNGKVIGFNNERLPNTSAVCFKDLQSDSLRILLELNGLCVSFGSACSGLAPEESFGLKALGLSKDEQKLTPRFSFGTSLKSEDISNLQKILKNIC